MSSLSFTWRRSLLDSVAVALNENQHVEKGRRLNFNLKENKKPMINM